VSVAVAVTARGTSGNGDRLWQHSKTMISSDPMHLRRPSLKTTSDLVALDTFAYPVALGSSTNDVLPLIMFMPSMIMLYAYY
jgi:hypothetical protein